MLHLEQGRPGDFAVRAPEEQNCYELLDGLSIPYDRVDHPEASTMEICQAIDAVLGAPICKNLFLCNRQQTQFYLLMMPGDKQFFTKDISKQLGVSRLSFASAEHMAALLGVTPGSVSVLGLMSDREHKVQLVIDKAVLEASHFGCHPCKNTASLRISLADLTDKLLPALEHTPIIVEL